MIQVSEEKFEAMKRVVDAARNWRLVVKDFRCDYDILALGRVIDSLLDAVSELDSCAGKSQEETP